MSNTEIFDMSNFTMCSGLHKPDDATLMSMVEGESKSKESSITTSMAMHLVLGERELPEKYEMNEGELADIAVLHLLLTWSKATQCLDIHKIMDMPLVYLKRWQKSFADAMEQGIIPKTDTPSADDLEAEFNME